ncbi:MAG: hypothetical protein U5L45_00120 [Saprospiraceae bacterium]|nr:hypothetical protein [Saprospiraceae bacterium]
MVPFSGFARKRNHISLSASEASVNLKSYYRLFLKKSFIKLPASS